MNAETIPAKKPLFGGRKPLFTQAELLKWSHCQTLKVPANRIGLVVTKTDGPCRLALCRENPRQICAFRQKYGSVAVLGRFFSEKACNFGANVIILYPTRGSAWIHPFFPAHSCASFFIFLLFSSFTFLSFTLLFPQGSKKGDDPSCTGSPPFLFVLVWLLFSGSGLQRPAGRRRKSRAFPVRRPDLLRPVPMRVRRLPRCWGQLRL